MSSAPQHDMVATAEEQPSPTHTAVREDGQVEIVAQGNQTEPFDFGATVLLKKGISKLKRKQFKLINCQARWTLYSHTYAFGLEAARPWPTLDCLDSSGLHDVIHIITQITERNVALSKLSTLIAGLEEIINRIETLLVQIRNSEDADKHRSLIEEAGDATRAGYATIKGICKDIYEDAFSRS